MKKPRNHARSLTIKVQACDPQWTTSILLCKEGWFRLEDVRRILTEIPFCGIKVVAHDNPPRGNEMGVLKADGVWYVDMGRFAPVYLEFLRKGIRAIDPAWSREQLLEQTGFFYLSHVAKHLLMPSDMIKVQAKTSGSIKRQGKALVVDMKVFGPHFRQLWLGMKTWSFLDSSDVLRRE